MREPPRLSLADWIVLALIAEEPKHGFAVAAMTAPDAEIGRVWHVPGPIVYRSVTRLTEHGLIRPRRTEHSARGPQRTVLAITAAGEAAVRSWLSEPVDHVRDVRSTLLVKLAILARRGTDPSPLIDAQRAVLRPIEAAFDEQQTTETDFGRVLAIWRAEHVRTALRFLDTLDETLDGQAAGYPGR